MGSNYEKILLENLRVAFKNNAGKLEAYLPALKKDNLFLFRAFGEDCCLGPDKISLSGNIENGPKGLLISLYAAHAQSHPIALEPWKAFKDLPGSMPYHGAFSINSERVLVPFVSRIEEARGTILSAFDGKGGPADVAGDFSILLYPLPKIALCYIFYLPDEEFPASVTCLLSNNALRFMPLDGLADVAEYSSKRIIEILE